MSEQDDERIADPYDDREYQLFVEDMAKLCKCALDIRPCDGVLAGGLCDSAG